MFRRKSLGVFVVSFAVLLAPAMGRAGYIVDDNVPLQPLGERLLSDPLLEALNLAARGDVDRARAAIDKLHDENPKAPGPYLGLAEIAVRKGDLKAADTWLSEGLEAAPKVSELYRARARLLLLQNKDAEAVAAFGKSIELAPKDARPRLELVDLFATRMKQPEKSVQYFKSVIALDEGNAAARYGLAFALAQLNRAAEAKAMLADAQRLAPDNAMPSVVLGQIYAREARNTEALAAFNTALKINPSLVVARVARGDLLQRTRKYNESIAEYQAALRLDPKAVNAMLGLGLAQQAVGQTADAQTSYRQVLAADPNQVLALNNLAWLSVERKTDMNQALVWAKKAVALAGQRAEFHDTLGWVHRERGELPEASKELERAVQLGPSAVTYTHLGVVRAALGQKTAAADAFNKALGLAPNYAPAQDGLRALR